MNILNLTASFPPAWQYGGPPMAAHAVARELQRLGHRVMTLTSDLHLGERLRVPRGADTSCEGVPVRYCLSLNVGNFFSRELGHELRRRISEFDLCLARGNWGYINFITRCVCLKRRKPYVLYPEGSFDPWALNHKGWKKRLWWRLIEQANYQQAAAVIALTRTEADQVRQMGVKTRVAVIPNGVYLDSLEEALSRGELEEQFPELGPEPFILFMGRLHEKKGLQLTLPALGHLPAKYRHTRLVVAGPDESGFRPRLEKIAQDLGLSRRVKFIGPISGKVKAGLLREAAVFVLNSLSEGLPLAVLEALACGTPVLISPFCNLPEVAEQEAGVIAPLEIRSIAIALEEVLRDQKTRTQMGKNGQRLVKENFTWSRVGELTEALCEDLVALS